ncbi:MAG: L,D-transpeptidase family protein [Thermoleophilaceae bacterium]
MRSRFAHIPSVLAGAAVVLLGASCGAEPPAAIPLGAPPAAVSPSEAPRARDRSPEPSGALPTAEPRSSDPRARPRSSEPHRIARFRGRRPIRYATAPGRPIARRLNIRTRFGTRRALAVAGERDGWIGLAVEDRPNGALAWVPASTPRVALSSTRLSVHVDLSDRRLQLRRGTRVLEAMTVGVGRADNRTPAGRYAVTDRLSGRDYPDAYGCCILALSGHQIRVPVGWEGGDRLAIHGTNAPDSLGRASSSGCVRAPERGIRRLIHTVPVGTPVFIRR